MLPSLELSIDLSVLAGMCDSAYSCVYLNTLSWSSPKTPLPSENNPRVVFERLFGNGGTNAQRAAQARQDRSILDFVGADFARLDARRSGARGPRASRRIPRRPCARSSGAFETVESLGDEAGLPALERPRGIPEMFGDHVKLMYELQWLAFQADLTRVVTFMLGRELNFRTYPEIGLTQGHHTMSHHQERPENIERYAKLNTYQTDLFAAFLEQARLDAGRRRHAARSFVVPVRRGAQQSELARAYGSAARGRRRAGRTAAASRVGAEQHADGEPAS